jgi:hypothetical protein
MKLIEAVKAYFAHLLQGDPVAWTFTVLLLALAAVLGIVAWRARRDERRWQRRNEKPNSDKANR